MGLISRLYNFVAGTPAVADQVDAEFDQILGVLNGNVDAANLAAGAVTLPKLAAAVLNNFTKLAASADRKEAFGSAVVTCSAGSGSLTIAHGLGVSPIGVSVTPRGFNFMGGYDNPGSVNVDLLVTDRVNAFNGPVTVFWRAVG